MITTLPPLCSQEPCKVCLPFNFDVGVLKGVQSLCTTVALGLDVTELKFSLEGFRFRRRSGLGGC